MHKIHLNLKKNHLKNYIPNIFFVSPFGLQLIWARSEENANPSTQQRELGDEKGRADRQRVVCGYCWEQDELIGKNENSVVKLWRLWIKGYKDG